jgi:hypothetical protein
MRISPTMKNQRQALDFSAFPISKPGIPKVTHRSHFRTLQNKTELGLTVPFTHSSDRWHARCNELSHQPTPHMNTTNPTEHEESTYALLVRSEQEERSLPESGVYLLLIICTAFAVWQSAQQPFRLPNIGLLQNAPIAQVVSQAAPHA